MQNSPNAKTGCEEIASDRLAMETALCVNVWLAKILNNT